MSLVSLPGWLEVDRSLAIFGILVTVLGTALTIWQVLRVRNAQVAAERASEATKATLRSGSLGRLIRLSMEFRARLEGVPAAATEAIKTVVRDWLDVYVQVGPLVDASSDLPSVLRGDAIAALEKVKILAVELVDSTASWLSFFGQTLDTRAIRSELLNYEIVMSRVLIALEDREVRRNAP